MGTGFDRRFTLLFALYFCQGLPGGFLAVALPAILREQGMSLTVIGFAGFLSLPWLGKVLWAPLVDRYGSTRFGRRRSWLVPAQLGLVLVTLVCGGLDPGSDLFAIAVAFLVLNVFAATQDIATDAWAIDMLRPDELGPANGAQVAGFKLGNLVGGGVLLAFYAVIGWRGDLWLMAAMVAAVLVLVVLTPESTGGAGRGGMAGDSMIAVLRRLGIALVSEGVVLWAFVFAMKFGETFGGAMVTPMLIDHGWTKPRIGLVEGVVGSIATIAGALLAGALVRRRAWWGALLPFSVLQGLGLIVLGIVQARGPIGLWSFAVLNGIENFAGGGVAVGVFALIMSRADRRVGGSYFTAGQVLYMSGAFAAGPLAGRGADALGYLPVMVTGGGMAIGLGLLAPIVARALAPSLTRSPA